MDNQKAKELLIKYSEGKCTPEEKAWVESWYLMDETVANKVSHQEVETAIEAVRANLPQPLKPALPLWPRIAVAASIIFALSFGVYLVLQKRHSRQIAQNQRQDIAPGRNQATLTLATGQKIVLTQTLNGQLAMLGNTMVKAQGGSGVSYTKGATAGPAVEKMAYNILSTVRGEKSPYPLILSDGTKVWLNAASSITFPTTFMGAQRLVKITGEVYFEVVHNARQPFKVEARGQTIVDIGTHFNINAYDDEADVRTTLLEGGISIATSGYKVVLKPGQQAIIRNGESAIIVEEANVEDVIAWKEGMFRFTNESLASILRKVSRWYNVDIEYTDNSLKDLPFGAVSTRFTDVSQVLKMIEMTREVHFKIEGKKIIVSK